jgi:hypothetical protein
MCAVWGYVDSAVFVTAALRVVPGVQVYLTGSISGALIYRYGKGVKEHTINDNHQLMQRGR